MELAKWITLVALVMLLAEGFVLSIFPQQFKRLIEEADPRVLQAAGLYETIIAAALIAGLVMS